MHVVNKKCLIIKKIVNGVTKNIFIIYEKTYKLVKNKYIYKQVSE